MKFINKYIEHIGKEFSSEIENVVCEFLPRNKNSTYLDCGCFDGRKTVKRAKKIGTTKILGMEILSDKVNEASLKSIKVFANDINVLWPFKNNSIDCITATEVIEHLVDLDIFFSESKRVLKKDGVLIISTENLASLHNIFALICGNQPYTGPYLSKKYSIGSHPVDLFHKQKTKNDMSPHLNVMTAKSLLALLDSYGFDIKKFKGVGYYPFPLIISKILAAFDKVHSSYAVIKATKH